MTNECGIQYEGQTKNRIHGHYQDIKTNNETMVARHFDKCFSTNKGQYSDLSISVLSLIHQQPHTQVSQLSRDTEEKKLDAPLRYHPPTGFKPSRLISSGFSGPT